MINEDKLATQEVSVAIWYVKHKQLLRRIVLGLVIVIDVGLVAYSSFGAGLDFLSFGKRNQQEMELLHSEIPLDSSRLANKPQDLQLGGVDLLRSGAVTDVLARVQNPNPSWTVQFSYTIGLGDVVEQANDGFLLPGEERPFFRSLRNAEGGVVFNIDKLSWRRVDAHEIPDFNAWRDERLNFEVKNARFNPAEVSTVGAQEQVGRAQFTISNKSAFSYFEPKFLVLLYRGSRLVGIQSTVVTNFKSGETREVELSWVDHIGAVSNIEIVPAINIMDEGVYLKP